MGASGAAPESRKVVPITYILVPILVLAILATGVGGYFLGQSTRKSDDVVVSERAAAVSRAVAAKGAEDKKLRLRIMERQEARLKARNRSVTRRVVRRLKKAMERRANQAYASGSSAGFSSGRNAGVNEGREEGIQEGIAVASDEVTCSDDPDVPLPYC